MQGQPIAVSSAFKYLDHPRRVNSFTTEQIKQEPMLFTCDAATAHRVGGYITREFLMRLPADWSQTDFQVDSRVHMLMPGWYPCIPGWHHDAVPRTLATGQPNYGEGQIRSEHILLLHNGDICPTEFAIGDALMSNPEDHATVYEGWHAEVESLLAEKTLERVTVESDRLVHFTDRTWHRGTAAVKSGWRFFIRASRYFDPEGQAINPPLAPANEKRAQVQVYLPAVNAGW